MATTALTAHQPRRSRADRLMRRVLRLPVDAPPGTGRGRRKAFQTSLLVATVRCLLMYIVFPFVLPAIGLASDVGPAIGLAISLAAIVCIVMSMRRFWRADHPKRWWYGALGGTVLCFLVVLAVIDLTHPDHLIADRGCSRPPLGVPYGASDGVPVPRGQRAAGAPGDRARRDHDRRARRPLRRRRVLLRLPPDARRPARRARRRGRWCRPRRFRVA